MILQSIKKPKLFWVSAGAPLASVLLSTLLVFAFKAQNHGISVVSFSMLQILIIANLESQFIILMFN